MLVGFAVLYVVTGVSIGKVQDVKPNWISIFFDVT